MGRDLKKTARQTRYTLPILVLIIVVIILFFGLRPKILSNANDTHWLSGKKALSFHNHGIAYVDALHISQGKQHSDDFTLQLSIAPESIRNPGFNAIFMLHGGDDRRQLGIWQWENSIVAMNGDDYDYSKKWPRISAIAALIPGKACFITITSSKLGTRLFIDGQLVEENKNWSLTVPNDHHELRLVLGNSVFGKHGWEGEIYGVEFHGEAYSPERVKQDYNEWRNQGFLTPVLAHDLQFRYSFDECGGCLLHDRTGHNPPLQLPSRLVILKKIFLSSPVNNFKPNKSFFIDVFLNLFGFIPLGAVAYCWLKRSKLVQAKYSALVIVSFGCALSLTIEIVQAWMPSRTSSALDLMLNTLGAWLGVVLINLIQRVSKDKSLT